MYASFTKNLKTTSTSADVTEDLWRYPVELQDFLQQFSGHVFNGGIYRIFGDAARQDISESITVAFPSEKGKFIAIGADWLGRIVALRTEGVATVMLFDPGTAQMSDSCLTLHQVHETFFANKLENMLAELFFEDWLKEGNESPGYGKCAGYKIPLFLGGIDEFENMEISDLSVYWHICSALIAQTC